MKNFKALSAILLVSVFGFIGCQNEINSEQGQNPNTNSANSTTTNNLRRTSMHDGSFDDFLDGNSCSSIILPTTAVINGQRISIFSQFDYQQVIRILAQSNSNQDVITLQFPLSVRLSNYTEVVINNQNEFNALKTTCNQTEASSQDAISCMNINFPMTILTYSLNLQQTGSIIITSDQQLYAYMNSISSTELYQVSYPISITFTNGTTATLNSDAELQSSIRDCSSEEDAKAASAAKANQMRQILVDGSFKIESYLNAGVESANKYQGFALDFTNDSKVIATNALFTTINGTYETSSEIDVFLNLSFTGNADFNLLNNTWKVTNFTTTTISLQSSTNAAMTIVLKQI